MVPGVCGPGLDRDEVELGLWYPGYGDRGWIGMRLRSGCGARGVGILIQISNRIILFVPCNPAPPEKELYEVLAGHVLTLRQPVDKP